MVPESPRGRDDILLERRLLMQADGIPADDIPDELVGLIIPWLDRWVLLSGTKQAVMDRDITELLLARNPPTRDHVVDTGYRLFDGVYQRFFTDKVPKKHDWEVITFGKVVVKRIRRVEYTTYHQFKKHSKILKPVRDARRKVVDPVDRCLVHGIELRQERDYDRRSTVYYMRKGDFESAYELTDLEAVLSRINPQHRMNKVIDDFLKRYENSLRQTAPHNPMADDGLGAMIAAHARQRFHESFNSLTIDGNAPEFAAPDHE